MKTSWKEWDDRKSALLKEGKKNTRLVPAQCKHCLDNNNHFCFDDSLLLFYCNRCEIMCELPIIIKPYDKENTTK